MCLISLVLCAYGRVAQKQFLFDPSGLAKPQEESQAIHERNREKHGQK